MATAHDVALNKSPVQNNKTAILLNVFIVFALAIIRDPEETAFSNSYKCRKIKTAKLIP